MKEKLINLLEAITDNWIFVIVMWAGIISLIVWKPVILLWFFAFIGIATIYAIISNGPLVK